MAVYFAAVLGFVLAQGQVPQLSQTLTENMCRVGHSFETYGNDPINARPVKCQQRLCAWTPVQKYKCYWLRGGEHYAVTTNSRFGRMYRITLPMAYNMIPCQTKGDGTIILRFALWSRCGPYGRFVSHKNYRYERKVRGFELLTNGSQCGNSPLRFGRKQSVNAWFPVGHRREAEHHLTMAIITSDRECPAA